MREDEHLQRSVCAIGHFRLHHTLTMQPVSGCCITPSRSLSIAFQDMVLKKGDAVDLHSRLRLVSVTVSDNTQVTVAATDHQ